MLGRSNAVSGGSGSSTAKLSVYSMMGPATLWYVDADGELQEVFTVNGDPVEFSVMKNTIFLTNFKCEKISGDVQVIMSFGDAYSGGQGAGAGYITGDAEVRFN